MGANEVLRQRAPASPGMEQDKVIASPKPARTAGENQTGVHRGIDSALSRGGPDALKKSRAEKLGAPRMRKSPANQRNSIKMGDAR